MAIYNYNEEVDVASIILAGGQGTRLHPLTQTRCKPDVIFGGRYRLIDIPLSASINSNINHIFVITQYLASHLNKHIQDTYMLSNHSPINLQILSPEEKTDIKTWYDGTADAVRKNLEYILDTPAKYYLILSGDHLYSMDLRELLNFARQQDADLTIASIPIGKEEASRMGLLKVNADQFVEDFYEKPSKPSILNSFKIPSQMANQCFFAQKGVEEFYLASMGIYVFKREALIHLLNQVKGNDFGKDIIPYFVKTRGKTAAYIYSGYWEDIGTVASYYRSTMELLSNDIGLNFYNELSPIYAQVVNLPCPLIENALINSSIICDGSIIQGDEIYNSLIGLRTYILSGSIIRNSIIMGNPHYLHEDGKRPIDMGHFTIGENCLIDGAIIDEGAQIGHNVTLVNHHHIKEFENESLCIRDGIIIVKAGVKIPDHTTLESLAA